MSTEEESAADLRAADEGCAEADWVRCEHHWVYHSQPDLPRQRKGLNPFLRDAPVRQPFTDEGVERCMRDWSEDQRMREQWRDGDTNTYRYRANLMEAVLVRWAASRAQLAAIRQLADHWDDEIRNGHGANRAGYERAREALLAVLDGVPGTTQPSTEGDAGE